MKIHENTLGKYKIIKPEGRINAANYEEFNRALDKAVSTDEHIVVECTELSYISSAGMKSLLAYLKKCKEMDKELLLVNLQPKIKEIFDITGFTNMFRIYSSLSEVYDFDN
ncbi:MAG: STAS domain-containing protein [Candidatus Kapaibacterium sp.]